MILKKNDSKFLLIPNAANFYDINQLVEIKNQLLNFGHQADVMDDKIDDLTLINFLSKNNYDYVFRVNKGRPKELKKNIRFISWFQDFYFDSEAELESLIDGDIIYFYSSEKSFGVKKKPKCLSSLLYPGISEKNVTNNLFDLSKQKKLENFQNFDFSLCGYIPEGVHINFNPLFYRNFEIKDKCCFDPFLENRFRGFLNNKEEVSIEKIKKVIISLQALTEINYKPLSGDLNVKLISKKIKNKIKKEFGSENQPILNEIIRLFSTDYPRFLDRITLARLMSQFSNNYALVGSGWTVYNEFSDFCKGDIQNQKELYSIYKKSKINLYNNTHGLGMHSKVFEIMINGGFLALPFSKNNNKKSGIEESFESDKHFVYFDPFKFDYLIEKWLNNEKRRIQIGENARKHVKKNHSWKIRVNQILNDLKK